MYETYKWRPQNFFLKRRNSKLKELVIYDWIYQKKEMALMKSVSFYCFKAFLLMDTVLRIARAKLQYEFENKYLITFELQFNVWCDAKQTDIFTLYSVIWVLWIWINNRSNLLRVNLKKETRVTNFCICRLHSNDLRVSHWNSEDFTMKINLHNTDRVLTSDIEQYLTELI